MYSFLKAFLVLMKLLGLSQFYAPKYANCLPTLKPWKPSSMHETHLLQLSWSTARHAFQTCHVTTSTNRVQVKAKYIQQ